MQFRSNPSRRCVASRRRGTSSRACTRILCLHSYPLKDQRWIFRGHANAAWNLEPSIIRLRGGIPNGLRIEAEEYIRQAFKRRAHHYLQYLPGEREELEWMALMRHHGAPTRLL